MTTRNVLELQSAAWVHTEEEFQNAYAIVDAEIGLIGATVCLTRTPGQPGDDVTLTIEQLHELTRFVEQQLGMPMLDWMAQHGEDDGDE